MSDYDNKERVTGTASRSGPKRCSEGRVKGLER